ncbi:MAG: sulfatase-like hydrolase/transferase [Candidatus Omnitrophica bacterium]|nr:sulfatase-like hydrolase/transferase [Candidatus Omnitrophota bacterium]
MFSKTIRTFTILVLLWMPGALVAERPPNIVMILGDDVGYGDLGCYGSEINKTPNIDKLADHGLRLTDFHTNGPMCSPTRAALLTGNYQQRYGKRLDRALTHDPGPENGLPPEAVTIAEVLKKAGYATGMYGKWHLGNNLRVWPTKQGFDDFVGLATGDGDFHTHISREGHEDWWHNEEIDMEEGYTTDLITQHSIDFIRAHQDEPFFLYIAHLAIHFPWQGPKDPPHRQEGKNYADDKWGIISDRSNVAPHVKAMIERLDDSVGKVVSTLEDLGLANNTLVVFCSDNGGYLNYKGGFENISSNGPLRGQKTDLYEGGHRVPAIFYWPNRIRSGESEETVLTMDLFPTFTAVADATSEETDVDGTDLSSFLFEDNNLQDRTIFWRANEAWAVRQGPWKLYGDPEGVQLYNLDQDIGETKDLSKEHPDLVARMTEAWKDWEADVDASAEPFN